MSYHQHGGNRGGRARFDDRGGGRGRFGGRGGAGGGGGGRGGGPRPTECNVVMNYNKLDVLDPSKHVDLSVYKVTIKTARYVPHVNEAGEKVRDPGTGKCVMVFTARDTSVCEDPKFKKRFFASEKPWRILKKLIKDRQVDDPSFVLDYDGCEMAIAPATCGLPDKANEFRVCIKQDCEEDNPDAMKVKNEWYLVVLTKTHDIPFSDIAAAISGRNADLAEELSMKLNVIMKSIGVQMGMLQLAPNSSSLFFPLREQLKLFNQRMIEADHGKKFLLSGIKQVAIFSSTGCNIQSDPIVNWFDKEKYEIDRSEKIPLIDGRASTIGGVRVRFNTLRSDLRAQEEVLSALSKLIFNVEYWIKKPDPKKEEAMIAQGKTAQDINESRRRVFMNQTLKVDQDSKEKIKWSPDDHSFQLGESEIVTVTQYYARRYGIVLDVDLPIVHIGKKHGWLPLEFCYQAFTKTRDANDPSMVQAVLQHYDKIAGTFFINDMAQKRNLISNMIGHGGKTFTEILAKYNLCIDNSPTKLRAKVLIPPKINFRESKEATNGSFDLRNVTFANPAEFNSFAAVNFTGDRHALQEYVNVQLEVAAGHGMKTPPTTMIIGREHLSSITENYVDRDAVHQGPEAVRRAIGKARDVYLNDSLNIFRKNHVWFRTTCEDVDGQLFCCLILPPQSRGGEIGIMFDVTRESPLYYTHAIELNDGRTCDRTRLIVKIRQSREACLNPFDVRFENGRLQAWNSNIEGWGNVDFDRFCFECHLTNGQIAYVDAEDCKHTYLHKERDFRIDCPSVIIMFLPDKGKALYDRAKFTSNQLCGIQTQCVVLENFKKQRNKNQYASNIAAKLNTKLSSTIAKAEAWRSSFKLGDSDIAGIPWVGECPTLVIGIGMAHGMGGDADTVIGASVCLDSECMRLITGAYLQKKADIINRNTMKDIIMENWDHYCTDNLGVYEDPSPQRILVYRDGMSYGSFDRANDEIDYIREAIKTKTNPSCPCDRGCKLCCPPITFVICQSQHNVRIVPAQDSDGYQVGRGGVNVHSGTMIDDNTIMELGTLLKITDDDTASVRELNSPRKVYFGPPSPSYDFLLTAQGGLKGTSKPIYYRVRLNENAVWGPRGCTALTKENIANCTHQMCYKYGSATKAVREVPIIKYAKKLANQVLSSLKYIREGTEWEGKKLRLEYPLGDRDDLSDIRPYVSVEVINNGGGNHQEVNRKHNVVKFSFHNHLAA
ncbi:hypothetical protein ACHAWX_005735 [Stephanocyclus meneghinianus]